MKLFKVGIDYLWEDREKQLLADPSPAHFDLEHK